MDDLAASDRAELVASHGRPFAAGEVLFREGDPARDALLLQEGRVRLLKVVRSHERTLMMVRPGELFGEGALLPGSLRSSTAVALTDGVMLVLPPSTFLSMLQEEPEVTPRILGQLVRRLRDAEDQVEIMMLRDTQSKVVAALLKAAERASMSGHLRADGAIVVSLSPMELSTRVGLAVDAVKTCVQRLREGQYVRVVDEQLEVLDVDALRKLYGLLGVKDQLRAEGPTHEDPSVRTRG
jgi:CRP/FNR family transcriptional regulator, cyclic AMP receptor protein